MYVGWVDSVVVTCLAAFDKPKLFLSPPSVPHSLTHLHKLSKSKTGPAFGECKFTNNFYFDSNIY